MLHAKKNPHKQHPNQQENTNYWIFTQSIKKTPNITYFKSIVSILPTKEMEENET